ncbi:MAG: type secretion system protein [Verrucomicrobiales bacterium]|nr:type secretion system protein [Verrucomicrobiales bacterium]
MQIRTTKNAGFTLVEIMIVVAIIGMLAAIAIPNFVSARNKAQATTCVNNLRIIDDAKALWALEARKSSGDTPTGADLQSFIGRGSAGQLPSCPNDSASSFATSYSPNQVDQQTVCNIGGANTSYPHKLP